MKNSEQSKYKEQFMDLYNETRWYEELKVIWNKILRNKLTEYSEGHFENPSLLLFQRGNQSKPPVASYEE